MAPAVAGCLLLIVIPLVAVYAASLPKMSSLAGTLADTAPLMLKSVGMAAGIALLAVMLGYVPGRLLGTARRGRTVLLLILMMHLLLPQYMLYYAWSILLSPTALLGQYVSQHRQLAQWANTITSALTAAMWYWPLAALLISQGWRDLGGELWDAARLDASPLQRWLHITGPLLVRPLALAWALCMALCLCEFTTFHLAGVDTIGTQLTILYQTSDDESQVAFASLPLAAIAAVMALVLWRKGRQWSNQEPSVRDVAPGHGKAQALRWVYAIALSCVSLLAPIALMAINVEPGRLESFFEMQVQVDPFSEEPTELQTSLLSSMLAAAMGLCLTCGALVAQALAGKTRVAWRPPYAAMWCTILKTLSACMHVSLLIAALLPGALVAVALLKALSVWPEARESFALVSAGQAARFAGVALIVLSLARDSQRARQDLHELSQLDGASPWQAFRYVHLPRLWPLGMAAGLMLAMFAMLELPVAMLLLPAGQKSIAQFLLNQMHYARDADVIATCVSLVALYALLAGGVLVLLRLVTRTPRTGVLLAILAMLPWLAVASGCNRNKPPDRTTVLAAFGRTGQGQVEFMYPRAIDIAPDGTLAIVDKAARVQLLTPRGQFISEFTMPDRADGMPCGLRFGPDGNLYIADTHYHRVMVFTRAGKLVRSWGKLGQGPGEFIYPTDIAFLPGGRILVSEYGGNDRVSVFDSNGKFLSSFGSYGSGQGQFSRPAAMIVDAPADRLYITDACNHRIAVYNLAGVLQRYIGSGGYKPGQLRYPYGMTRLADGTLAVCEYGNSRIQLLRTDGTSVAVFGGAGRAMGQLTFPWSLAVDSDRRAYVLDSGNNRVQIWQL